MVYGHSSSIVLGFTISYKAVTSADCIILEYWACCIQQNEEMMKLYYEITR